MLILETNSELAHTLQFTLVSYDYEFSGNVAYKPDTAPLEIVAGTLQAIAKVYLAGVQHDCKSNGATIH